jgi:hypothetical protein
MATDTFYAGAGDGFIESLVANWDTCHDATSGTSVDATGTTLRANSGLFTGNYSIRRAFLPFDTSAIPDTNVVSAATLYLYCTSLTSNSDNDGEDFFVPVGTTQADPTTLAVGDFDQCGAINAPTELSDDRKDYGSLTLNAYNTWVLNAAGLAAISKTGYTLIGLREGHDVLDHAYAGADPGSNQVRFATSEDTSGTKDPYLVVTHAAAATGSPWYYYANLQRVMQ